MFSIDHDLVKPFVLEWWAATTITEAEKKVKFKCQILYGVIGFNIYSFEVRSEQITLKDDI